MKVTRILSLIVLLSFGFFTLSFAQGDTWESAGDMPTLRGNHSASVVDDIIYLIGGVTLSTYPNATPLVEAYDPVNGTWETKAPMLTPRNCVKTCVLNGLIYAIGGSGWINEPSHSSAVEVYDPATNIWTEKANLPQTRIYLGVCTINGKIYSIGGMNSFTQACATNYEYDPVTDVWTVKNEMPTARNYISVCAADDIAYVFGGAEGALNASLNLTEAYDPLTDTWEQKQHMPIGKQFPECCEFNNKIYVMGGRTQLIGIGTDDNYEYDPIQNRWFELSPMPVPRVSFSICSLLNEKIYVIGGSKDDTAAGAVSQIDIYTPPLTGVEQTTDYKNAHSWTLKQNYPNPFNPETEISFQLPKSEHVQLTIYNMLGKQVHRLVNETVPAGEQSVQWDSRDDVGNLVPSGVYLYTIEAGTYSKTMKMILLR